MADACMTITLAREDRERVDALVRELAQFNALLAGQPLPCPNTVSVLEGINADGSRRFSTACAVRAGFRNAPACGRCDGVRPPAATDSAAV